MNDYRIAVMAPDIEADLVDRLQAAGYRAYGWETDVMPARTKPVLPVHQITHLLTHFGTEEETSHSVLPVLPVSTDGATWVQLGPLSFHEAAEYAEYARRLGVRYIHAPLIPQPRRAPMCVACTDPDDAVAPLLQAVAVSPVRWIGPLARWLPPGHHTFLADELGGFPPPPDPTNSLAQEGR